MADKTLIAPEFPDTLEWINTDQPLQLSALRGKIILLDFWTSGSIACQQMHADLRYLQNKYHDHLLVIGIHTPRFAHEKVRSVVQKSLNRQHIRFPAAHDPSGRMCKKYGIRGWPSQVLIDATGRIIGRLQGEGKRRHLDDLIRQYIEAAEQKNLLSPGTVLMHGHREPHDVLSFPGKLLAGPSHVYISDSGHNRVVEINQYGRVTRVFGSGGAGLLDGNGRDAAFNNPQGLAWVSNFLYVADCGNHALRRIDLTTQDIMTIAGDGSVADVRSGEFPDPAAVRLNAPMDLYYQDGVLYIAMAGLHQLWKLRLTDNRISVLAGNGHTDMQDGKAGEASFAQPCGIAVDDYRVYACDAGASAIRLYRSTSGQVTTLIGRGLSVSGDVDSSWSRARLQHPQSIAIDSHKGLLYVADTYNNKIKVMDLDLNSIQSLDAGKGLDEPGGLSLHENTLWIANTNAHEIRKLNLLTHEVEVVELNEPEQDF